MFPVLPDEFRDLIPNPNTMGVCQEINGSFFDARAKMLALVQFMLVPNPTGTGTIKDGQLDLSDDFKKMYCDTVATCTTTTTTTSTSTSSSTSTSTSSSTSTTTTVEPTLIRLNSNAKATPYPSHRIVTGLSGVITQVTVTMVGLQCNWVQDFTFVLVSPTGTACILWSAVLNTGTAGVITITLDRLGTAPGVPIHSGIYGPYDNHIAIFGGPALLPSPAPSGPYGHDLSIFNGENPNGTWLLYIISEGSTGLGTIANWSVNIASA